MWFVNKITTVYVSRLGIGILIRHTYWRIRGKNAMSSIYTVIKHLRMPQIKLTEAQFRTGRAQNLTH